MDGNSAIETPDFRVMVELQAIMDYMAMLRGLSKDAKHYKQVSSLELTRFPSFDGSDWSLPESFDDYFQACVQQHRLFSRVRPYDFAVRDIAFLREKGADIIVYVPPQYARHAEKIQKWTSKYFPGTRIVAGDIRDINPSADVWVARTPELVDSLVENKLPVIVIDGKENADIVDVIRAVRWDQAGYFLRHSQMIKNWVINDPDRLLSHHPAFLAESQQSGNINHGFAVFPPNTAEGAIWVGSEKAISRRFASPDFIYVLGTGEKLSPSRIETVKQAQQQDMLDLDRKERVIRLYTEQGLELQLQYPQWSRFISFQELEMQIELRRIETIIGMDPIRGTLKHVGRIPNIPSEPGSSKRNKKQHDPAQSPHVPVLAATEFGTSMANAIVIDRKDLGIPINIEASELITLIAESANVPKKRGADSSNLAGYLAETMALRELDKRGWKILEPSRQALIDNPASIEGQINVRWIDKDDVLNNADVDGLLIDPDGKLHVIEVKIRDLTKLSPTQTSLMRHLEDGGKILNPQCKGLRKDTVEFSAIFTPVVFKSAENTSAIDKIRGLLSR